VKHGETEMQRIRLGPDELKCLRFIASHESARASEIASALGTSRVQLSRVIPDLVEKGFLSTEKLGLSKNISLSETKHAGLWRKLTIEFGHMPLHELLSGGSLEVLSAIGSRHLTNRRQIAENSLVSESTAAQVLENLRRRGIVQKEGAYRISPRFQILAEFTAEFRRYMNQRIALGFAPDAVIVWERNEEFIVESSKSEQKDGFLLTGISALAEFGVPLLAPKSYFFYSPFTRKLRLEDTIVHSLLIPNGSLLPTLLVWKRNEARLNIQYLRQAAEKYDATASITEIVHYFESQGSQRSERFPPWSEFLARAREYGIQ
jgi:DNA-binding MarR family transcriptional regulator